MSTTPEPTAAQVIAATRQWLERAVIGLNLCPFAKPVHLRNQIRYAVSEARTEVALLADLRSELVTLRDADPDQIETTLLLHPRVLRDFGEFNQFLDAAEAVLTELDLVGEIQLASFHPDYQFAGTEPDDVTNCTNRSPFPTLHLLREASIARAVAAFPRPEEIYEANQATLRRLGHAGWRRLWVEE